MSRLKLISVLACIWMVGCGPKSQDSQTVVSPEEATVESAMAAVSGLADEQSGESYARLQSQARPDMYAAVRELLIPSAHASGTCDRAVFSPCSQGTREVTYQSCRPTLTAASLNGYVRLTYSDVNCAMTSAGDAFTRTQNLDYDGPRGGTAQISSDPAPDYRGTTYGGGGKTTRTATGYTFDLSGKHVRLAFRGRDLYRVSMRTLNPLVVTGTLARAGRELDGGELEVNHNLVGLTAVYRPHNLRWQNGCCYPVSGTLDVEYSGSRTGSATVTFNGCGTATHSDGVQNVSLALSYCE